MTVFVDTSTWYAAADRGDRSNARAKQVLLATGARVTSDHVLIETWQLLHHRLGRAAADQFWDGLRRGVASVEPITSGDIEVAWHIGEEFPDQDFSIVDRTSFALMHRLGLTEAVSFDNDFAIYRFGRDRGRAFTVLR